MKLKYVCPFWGQDGKSANVFIDNVINAGYNAVEVNIPANINFETQLKSILSSTDLDLIGQQWLQPLNESVTEYSKRLEERLYKLAEFNPIFINSHTGRDFFTFDENCAILETVFKFEKETGINVYHETHRGRFNYSAKTTENFINKFPNLKLTADFSHWTVVSESLLEDQKTAVDKAINNSRYLHARIADTQKSQVNYPFTDENKIYLDTFTNWWKQIISNAQKTKKDTFYICPEFGPYPYMPYQPNTTKHLVDQWDLNVKMMQYLKQQKF
ncbi:MAG: sugar phosphate isomerase/epimerase [Cellulophaga sp.]|uniref:sugar phosphate isomerase/epimerase n=1 Tax=unclassified Cellulophaga TaxID=2634405 RepID=UPI000C2CD177|nr:MULTISPECIES: sugar phosphate isomerase/epimerase [unclassified Cellulophaga]MDO6492268.1 sugar phosphate isomerase/epimerase [Cellulophaga sp. 2_MG-2023]MDO6493218.1 sugar phosphate isomerase/epimerase [Cellulophaga sp. 3_MG-2023]PKB44792.1 hypothetical protein AX016_3014 [Cellulophaga sp. RHA19]